MSLSKTQETAIWDALDALAIEIPSWGFANTGTRFGKFIQPGAATCIEEKLADAGQVHRLTGCCPSVAVHAAWDFPKGVESAPEIAETADCFGVRIGSVNPTLFEEQCYKYGSLGNPDEAIRQKALNHIFDCVKIARAVGSSELVLWFADGSNYPGTANIRKRKQWFADALKQVGEKAGDKIRLLVEYKPFEPAFYHTDIADWGMALLLARAAGPNARVLVDTGHHYPTQNIEQIVAWLLSEEMLGGFHFNDRRYGDDDLTTGSIDPYQLFRIFQEICFYRWETGRVPDISYMIDQSHNLKNKIEAVIQTVDAVQDLYARAVLVDYERLDAAQSDAALIDAENYLKEAFFTDVRPAVRGWRRASGLPEDPLTALRKSGYLEEIAARRGGRNRQDRASYV